MNNKNTRIALYVRSTARDSQLSLDAQEARLRAAIDQHFSGPHDIVGVYRDEGSYRRPLPGRCRMVGAITAGEVDVLAVTRIDRISRSAVGVVELLTALEKQGGRLWCPQVECDTSTVLGRTVVALLRLSAESESGYRSERIKAALAARRSR